VDAFRKLIDWKTAAMRNPADQLISFGAGLRRRGGWKGKDDCDGTSLRDRARPQADISTPIARWPRQTERTVCSSASTSPEDLRGMIAAEGILTARGGVVAAALVARQMGKVCVCGAGRLKSTTRRAPSGRAKNTEGDWLSIDGTEVPPAGSNRVVRDRRWLIEGDAAARKTEKFKNFQQLMKWCDDVTRMSVRTNADTPSRRRTPSRSAPSASARAGLSTCSSRRRST
jgi:pyruvate,orthophosphate dikinase